MKRILLVITSILLASGVYAQSLPKHYPSEGFQRTGVVDAVYPDELRIVINDMPFVYSKAVIVRSLSSNRASLTRVRPGVKVAYKMGSDQRITEMWLLPPNYSDARRRGR